MPKPGGKPSWKKQYNEHDMRGGNNSNIRRVTFKHGRSNKKGYQRDWADTLKAHLEDDDVDMGAMGYSGGSGGSKKFHGYSKKHGRHGSPPPSQNLRRKLFSNPSCSWYRIVLPYGNKYDKDFVMRTLLQKLSPLPLCPIMWNVNGQVISFYVDDYKVADKLLNLDRQVQLPDGYKMIIRVHVGTPTIDIGPAMKERMKLTMAKRYNAANKALDLTKFHADPDLQDLFCALLKPQILQAVIDIIAENIPEIEALNLHDNRIYIISHLKKLSKKLPNLKILHLGNNKIRDISFLDVFCGLPIVELVLDGNPLCDKFKDQNIYISEIRKKFPKVMKLDGFDLPPRIGFDISEEVTLPSSQQTFLCNAEGQGIVRQFLEQYYQIFDSDSRQPLLQAYHENATFSLTSCYAYGQTSKTSAWLNWYNTDSRNLDRIRDPERRLKLLKQGQLAVVSFLSEMPATKHDILGFTVDLSLFTPQMLLLTVTGCFRELRSGHKTAPVRHFYRTLVIIPAGSGFCIANDMLHVTNATEEQAKLIFKSPIVTKPTPTSTVSSPVTANAASPSTSQLQPSAPAVNEETKQQMIQAMALQSGMNLQWSQKCLEETNWDFNRAAFIFTELQKQGTIPPEAFQK